MVSAAFGCHGFTLVCDFHHKFRKYKKSPKLPQILISRFVEFFVVFIHRFVVLGVDLHCHKFSSPNSSYFSPNRQFFLSISAQIDEQLMPNFLKKSEPAKAGTPAKAGPRPAKAVPSSSASHPAAAPHIRAKPPRLHIKPAGPDLPPAPGLDLPTTSCSMHAWPTAPPRTPCSPR
jgi:hypothetical protein